MEAVSQAQFDRRIARAPGLVLVDFHADWCGPCKVVRPILDRLEPDFRGQVDFLAVDSDRNQALAQAFGVRSLPTVLLLAPHEDRPGADVVGVVIGARPPDVFRAMIDRALNPKAPLLTRLKQKLFGGGEAKADGAAPTTTPKA